MLLPARILSQKRPDHHHTFPFRVQAADGRGGIDLQVYSVTVRVGQPNQLPTISPIPALQAARDRTLAYPVSASDPDGDLLSYYLLGTVPTGMKIDRSTGLITWTPNSDQVGTTYTLTAKVFDARGGSATRDFSVTAVATLPNLPPDITTNAVTAVIARELYTYDAHATDPEYDLLTFDLPVHPIGMAVDPDRVDAVA